MKQKKKRKLLIISLSITIPLIILITACIIYICDYYPADEGAIAVFAAEENISVKTLDNGNVVFEPQGATMGFIFYPGGKVEHNAYQPLMSALARRGILCILVEMPFRLAVLDIDAADGIQEQFPQIENWYIGGHSLGGSMAASYVSDHADEFDGLILLAAYSTSDLSNKDLNVISIYGSKDTVLNLEKYKENLSNLPDDFSELIIEGGNHAQFGMYGKQDGDGTPTISNSEQITQTADHILNNVTKKGN